MWHLPRGDLRQSALSALLGSIALATLTAFAYRFHLEFSIASPLYLLVVILQSLSGDLVASAAVSILAAGLLDFFLVEPVLTFRIGRLPDALALASFLATALVITRLVAKARAEAESSSAQRDLLDRLYRLSEGLLALGLDQASGEELLEPFHRIFGATAVCLFDARTADSHLVGHSLHDLAEETRDAYIMGRDSDNARSAVSVRRMYSGGACTGAVGFEGISDGGASAASLAALTNILLERVRSVRSATAASAAAQIEVSRGAILDALAHEFKTPLATILAAAGGIREAGPLRVQQSEMVETVESEAARLGRLTSRLLRIARLDREDVRPRIEPIDISSLAGHIADQYGRQFPDRRVSVLKERGAPIEVLADPELLRLAVSQLVENACKYSVPGAAVQVSIERSDCQRTGPRGKTVSVKVSNSGSSIPDHERRLIFDRFYRGTEVKSHTSGSGLGLYVARKIALAHGGSLDLDTAGPSTGSSNDSVTFRLQIPASGEEPAHAAAD